MKFFFDNNLSPHLAGAMSHLAMARPMGVTQVVGLRDMFPTNTPDETWLQKLHQEGGWKVLSIDQFKKTMRSANTWSSMD